MMTKRKVRKINKLIYKLYKSYWQDNQDVYAEIQSINYSMVEDTLELEIAWGNNTKDHHYCCTVFAHDYLKSARDIAMYIMAMIDSKEI